MSRRPRSKLLLSLALLLAVIWPGGAALGAAPRQQAAPISMDVRVGFDGYVQRDSWTPVTVTVANDGPDLDARLRLTVDPFTGTRTHYTRPIDLPRGSRKRVTLYAADVAGFGSDVQVDLLDENGRVVDAEVVRVQVITPTTLLIGVWSDTPGALADLALVEPSSGETRLATLTVEDFPEEAAGWQALDVLVAADVDTGQLSAAQQAALGGWVAAGGRLIIVGGVGFQRTLSGLAEITPVQAQATENMSLEALGEAVDEPLDGQVETPVAVGPLADDAQVLVAAEDVPLLASRTVGYGRIDFLAPDPGLEPLASWDQLATLWRLILTSGAPRPAWGYGQSTQWDYARQAVASVPGVSLPSVLQLCGFLGVYVLLVGPVNYIVLSRLKRRELAWITIPALILLFSAMAYITGFQLRGSRAIVHRLAVVQSWEGSDVATVDGLIGVWSPRRARYDVELEPGLLARPLQQNLGGALTTASESVVAQTDHVTLEGVSVDIGSIRPFAVQGVTGAAARISADLTLHTEQDGIYVTGRIHNAGRLDLADASLVLGGTPVPIGDLPAGASLDVDELLAGGRASQAAGSPLEPFPADAAGYYAGPFDTLVTEISGGTCYATPDVQRRCNLILSVMNGQAYGSDIYLFGWADSVPFDAAVRNAGSDPVDLALHIVQLDAALLTGGDQAVEVPPGLMEWELLGTQTYGYGSPYDMYLYPGQQYGFRFEPSPLVPPLEVESFTVHLETLYGNEEPPLVQLRNVETNRWDNLTQAFGDTEVDTPERYLDSRGGIQMRLVGGDESFGTQVSRFDVTFYGNISPEVGE